jgi:putative ABC transport system substrate-binding protein
LGPTEDLGANGEEIVVEKIGLLHTGKADSFTRQVAALKSGLGAMGYWTEQSTPAGYTQIEIVPKWNKDQSDAQLQELAEALAEDNEVKLIVAAGGPQSAEAAKEKTAVNHKSIVFTTVASPKDDYHFVNSYAQPGTNLTGTAGMTSERDCERLRLLHVVLRATTNKIDERIKIKVPKNKKRPKGDDQYARLVTCAQQSVPDADLDPDNVQSIAEILDHADLDAGVIHGRLVLADSLFNSNRMDVVNTYKNKPVIYQWREFVEIGGLMSYGPNIQEAYFTAGVYAGRILRGQSVANIPVAVPTRYELVINMKTWLALFGNVPIPDSLKPYELIDG